MKLTDREKLVLVAVLRDRERLVAESPFKGTRREEDDLSRRLKIVYAKQGFIALDLSAWLGREPTPSERVLFSRTYMSLDRKELLTRPNLYGEGNRTTHLQLTPVGEEIASKLLKGEI